MFERDFDELAEILREASETLRGGEITPTAAMVYFKALRSFPIEIVRAAVEAHYLDPDRGRFMPLPADIAAQVRNAKQADGRPNADEAWALMPKREDDSGVITREMLGAWDGARALHESDEVGARMAFRSAYERLVKAARDNLEAVEWVPSLGRDSDGRALALDRAVTSGRITRTRANQLLLEPPKVEHLLLASSIAAGDPNISPRMKVRIDEFMKGINERAKKYDAVRGR